MTAPSPVELASGAVALTVTSDGTPLASTVQVVAVDIWTGVNRLPRARLAISDGSAAAGDFAISASSALVPGATLAIALGYGSDATPVFTGVIDRHAVEASTDAPSRLVVEATSRAMAMTLARANMVFENVSDSALCETLIAGAGLSAKVTATAASHASIVQYYASAWDLMILRAEANGMVVLVDGDTVTVAPPDTAAEPVLTLGYGGALLDARLRIDAATQYAADAIASVAWDPAQQALAQAQTAQTGVETPGNLDPATLAGVFGIAAFPQQTAGAMASDELSQWSNAELTRSRLAKLRGTARFQGSALAVPGCTVALAGLGTRFDGNAWVSGVHHRLAEGLWRTTVEFGLPAEGFAATAPRIAAPAAAAQMPPVATLQIGTVQRIDGDPQNAARVQVLLPLLQSTTGVWARLGGVYASAGFGAVFYPEVGDEVIVAFLDADPRYPVILGALYSAKHTPPVAPAAENDTKSIVTRTQLRLDFLEDSKTVRIVTPANQSVVVDDSAKSIVLTDASGNTVTLGEAGIAIRSVSDISITASGSITVTADASLSAKGTGSAAFASDGVTQVKGATVALNP